MKKLIPICAVTLVLAGCATSGGSTSHAYRQPNTAAAAESAPTHRYDPFFDDRHARSRYSYAVPRDGESAWHRRPD